MPESQFGSSPGSLSDTLDELVALARHLRSTPASVPSRLTRLEGLCQMLSYFVTPGIPPDERSESWPVALTTHCAHHDCSRTWRDFDACFLNFARLGEPPIWLCRDHHPPLSDGGIRPPGWQSDDTTRATLDATRHSVFTKLSPAERSVINTRIVDMSGSSSGE